MYELQTIHLEEVSQNLHEVMGDTQVSFFTCHPHRGSRGVYWSVRETSAMRTWNLYTFFFRRMSLPSLYTDSRPLRSMAKAVGPNLCLFRGFSRVMNRSAGRVRIFLTSSRIESEGLQTLTGRVGIGSRGFQVSPIGSDRVGSV